MFDGKNKFTDLKKYTYVAAKYGGRNAKYSTTRIQQVMRARVSQVRFDRGNVHVIDNNLQRNMCHTHVKTCSFLTYGHEI